MFSLLKTGSRLLKIKSLELNHHYVTLVHSSSIYFVFDCSILKMILKDLCSLFSLIFCHVHQKLHFLIASGILVEFFSLIFFSTCFLTHVKLTVCYYLLTCAVCKDVFFFIHTVN